VLKRTAICSENEIKKLKTGHMNLSVIQNKIYEIRGYKVMLDFDLAEIYGTNTKVLNQSVKRNIKRFPSDFMFQLTNKEFTNLRSQIATSRWGGSCYQPFAFTELGVAMNKPRNPVGFKTPEK
jgi:hypothetical protein